MTDDRVQPIRETMDKWVGELQLSHAAIWADLLIAMVRIFIQGSSQGFPTYWAGTPVPPSVKLKKYLKNKSFHVLCSYHITDIRHNNCRINEISIKLKQ
jgi:hypothetical protein